MSVSAVVESVFNTILEQLADEVGALLGAPIAFAEHQLQIITKDNLLKVSRGRSVLSTMTVSGDNSGEAFIITDLKDSVILGGTLIMLPAEQIEENCKQRQFGGEAADAYGEVANIIAGVYTSVFLDLHPDNYHFKRTSVEDFVPTQVDPASDTPFPPGEYIYSCCNMQLDGFDLHNLEIIVPASLLGEGSQPEAQDNPDKDNDNSEEPTAAPDTDTASTDNSTKEETPATEPEEPEEPADDLVTKDTVDRVLIAAMTQCAEEIGAMLGLELEVEGLTCQYTSKKEFFARPGKKTIATQMIVSGDSEGSAYFLTNLKDAIYFAGTMIMLPADEIESHIKSGEFGEDEQDAFAEVANIISGGLVQNFDEMYPHKFHLKKGEQELYTPTKVKIEEATPFPPGEYYIVTGTLSCDDRDLSDISFICPVDLLHMEPRPTDTAWGAPSASEDTPTPAEAETTTEQEQTSSEKPATTTPVSSTEGAKPASAAATKPSVIVIISDDTAMQTHFSTSLQQDDHEILTFNTGDSFNDLRQKNVVGTFFVMAKVDEQSFATIIKISSELPQKSPLIVAGPQWTRSQVLTAVRYGATDIMVTPASEQEICEKAQTNLKITCH